MGVAEIKQEIEELEVSVKKQQQSFLTQRHQIVDAIKPSVKERLRKDVEDEVRSNPEHTKELGKAALSEMKKRLNDLIENSDRVVEETFQDDGLWVYVGYSIIPGGDRYGQAYNNKNSAKNKIHKGISIVLGEAGKILIGNKYMAIGSKYCWDNDMIYDYTKAGKGQSKLVCKVLYSLPKDIEQLIDEYCNRIEVLHNTLGKIIDLQKRLSEQEAADLWNEL